MDNNRRTTFRAALVDAPAATLVCGRTALDVELVNESSGGLSVVAATQPSFALDSEAELSIADGRILRVVVKNYSPQGSQTRIGLERREVPMLGRPDHPSKKKPAGVLTYAIVVLLGVLLGCLALSEPVREWFLQFGS